jgi:serine protease Do
MNRLLFFLVLMVLFPYSQVARSGTPPVTIGVYPVPATEIKDQIIVWLRGSGFRISQGGEDTGEFTLECSRGRERLLVEIRPNSPLASIALVSDLTGIADGGTVVNGLKASLETYVRNLQREGPVALQKIPDAVLSQEKAVFCLSASLGSGTVEFSGFAVDRNGLIVTTAHDLDGISEIIVCLENGEKYAGKVIRRDPLRDLTLIKVEKSLAGTVPVNRGRRRLNMREKIFSTVCPAHNQEKMRTGIVDEPPAIVNGQPLWQVNMDVAPGDSGGPVFDSEGRLVGVVKGRFRGGWSRGFLIPTNTLRDFLGLGRR